MCDLLDPNDYFNKQNNRKRNNIGCRKQQPNLIKPITNQKESINQIIKNRTPIKTAKSDIIPDFGLNVRVASSYSIDSYGKIQVIPEISTFPKSEFDEILYQKLEQCLKVCNFKDFYKHLNGKAVKESYLNEILSYIKQPEYYQMMTLRTHEMLFEMFNKNVVRVLPPVPDLISAPSMGDDIIDKYFEDSWPHLEIVYNIFIEYLKSPSFNEKYLTRKITHSYVLQLVGMFKALDKRERTMLQLTIYAMYSRFIQKRDLFRFAMKQLLTEVHYDKKFVAGIPEILNVLLSIIKGFSLPLKKEHVDFLFDTLLPLMSVIYLPSFYKGLINCILMYLSHDSTLLVKVFREMLRYWPTSDWQKEIIFLLLLRELLTGIIRPQFKEIMTELLHRIGKCTISDHYAVSESALKLWGIDNFIKYIRFYSTNAIPIILPYLYQAASNHWNNQIKGLANLSIRVCIQINIKIVDDICRNMGFVRNNQIRNEEQTKQDQWSIIKQTAQGKDPNIEETQISLEQIAKDIN